MYKTLYIYILIIYGEKLATSINQLKEEMIGPIGDA